MSQITIQCRLVASEFTRHQLWKLMADKNTPLINELVVRMQKHPEFETWTQKGRCDFQLALWSNCVNPLKLKIGLRVSRAVFTHQPFIYSNPK